jgi:cell division protein FtsI/penicillin-binding protein 2
VFFSRKRRRKSFQIFFPNRLFISQIGAVIFFLLIALRLFYLQVLEGEYYANKAIQQRRGVIDIPARRGEILARDKNTGNIIKLATNTTLDLVYIDPKEIPDKRLVANTLAPILYTDEDFELCLDDPRFCPEGSVEILEPDGSVEDTHRQMPTILYPTKDEAVTAYADSIHRKINREKIDFVLLKRDVSDKNLDAIEKMNILGIEIIREKSLVFVDPTKISQDEKDERGNTIFFSSKTRKAQKERKNIAKRVSDILRLSQKEVLNKLIEKDVRYVKLRNKIRPEISEKIREIKRLSKETHKESEMKRIAKGLSREGATPDYFFGVVLIPEHWRYYPDNEVAAQIVGFVNNEGRGQYGIEGKFDRLLSGSSGFIESQNDVSGKGINPGTIRDAEDGMSIVLTLDRVVQRNIENILSEAIKRFHADSGQIIVMEPDTGKIIAMANAPLFNPNSFGDSLQLRRTVPDDFSRVYKTTPLFVKDEHGRFEQSFFEDFEEAWKLDFDPEFYVYENHLGPGAFINRTVQEVYEPGSVFKPVVMAVALETGEVTPRTTFHEDGPVEVGDFTIKTALNEYHGIQTMTNVLETSSNVGMVFVALKLGKSIMHSFLVSKFGFGDYTNIDLDNEESGRVLPKKDWSDAHLLTASFGQGLTATPIQVVRAWCALANGGILVRPQIVEEKIYPDGTSEIIEPQVLRRVLSPDTSTTITSMLVSSVENGVARSARVPGYRVAGKTGTSQIAGVDGKYETGEGAFITSFAGYAPADDPKFVVYVKFDRPRYGTDNTWGSTTAAPIFRDVMKFLLEYSNIQPDQDLDGE